MAETIECPHCKRKLRMDDSVFGRDVQCPSCRHTFIAESPSQPPAPRPIYEDPYFNAPYNGPPPTNYHDPLSPQLADEEPVYNLPGGGWPHPTDYETPRPRYDEEGDNFSRRATFRDTTPVPHRGSAIRGLGILSLLLCWVPCLGLILAVVTNVMARSDLTAMRSGEMDASGESATQLGSSLSLIAALVALLTLCLWLKR